MHRTLNFEIYFLFESICMKSVGQTMQTLCILTETIFFLSSHGFIYPNLASDRYLRDQIFANTLQYQNSTFNITQPLPITGSSGGGPLDLYNYLTREFVEGVVHHKCILCGKLAKDRGNMRKHVENIHFPNSYTYPCKYCAEMFGTRNSLNMHISKVHRMSVV